MAYIVRYTSMRYISVASVYLIGMCLGAYLPRVIPLGLSPILRILGIDSSEVSSHMYIRVAARGIHD